MHNLTQHFVNEFEKHSSELFDQSLSWLKKNRELAIASFAKAGLPSRQQETWKYTSLNTWASQLSSVTLQPTKSISLATTTGLLPTQACYQITFLDGVFQPQHSFLPPSSAKWTLKNLAAAVKENSDKIEPHLNTANESDSFATLNTACWQDGLFLEIPNNIIIDKPIVLNIASTQSAKFNNLRHLIIANSGSRVTVIEHYHGIPEITYFNNSITQLIVADNAHVDHYKIQQESMTGLHVGSTYVSQQANSQVNSHVFSLGGLLGRSDTHINLEAENAACNLYGLYLAKDKQHLDHYTRIAHLKPHGISKEYYKGIVDNKAHAIFNGIVYVAPQAQKTSAEQHNKNLLLSRLAEVDTRPQLEIYADDVKCAHGATVGQIDEDALFYLRARGLDIAEAQTLLIHAFAAEIIEQVTLPELRKRLEEMLTDKLNYVNSF